MSPVPIRYLHFYCLFPFAMYHNTVNLWFFPTFIFRFYLKVSWRKEITVISDITGHNLVNCMYYTISVCVNSFRYILLNFKFILFNIVLAAIYPNSREKEKEKKAGSIDKLVFHSNTQFGIHYSHEIFH